MNMIETTWNPSGVNVVLEGPATMMIRMDNEEAERLYNELSLRAANHDLFDKDGTFTIGRRVYDLTAGEWGTIWRSLGKWYEQYFDAFYSDDLFGAATPVTLRVV